MTSNQRRLITITIMLVAVIEILDSTIVNVSLPHMMGSLGANAEQITWVLTSYVVSSAIVMPLTGFLVDNVGQKRLLLIMISGFMLASMLCGMTTSLSQIVTCRILQGVFGAGLVPISQYILRDIYSDEEQGKAMAIWGIGVMVAPILGPTIGGYITEFASWRWIFYINVPICAISLLMTILIIPETIKKSKAIDWTGLILMAVGIGCLQIFLDRGNQAGWLSSNLIFFLIVISITAVIIFIARGLRVKNNIVNLRLFNDRNYALSTLMLVIYAAAMFSALVLQPIMLEHLLGYPVQLAGLVMAPRGLASAFAMILVPSLMKRFGSKILLFVGIMLSIYGTYATSRYNLSVDVWNIIWPGIVQGAGMGLFFVPLSVEAFKTLPKNTIAEASGLFGFGRMLGTSIGISLFSTIVSRETQTNWNRLGGHINIFNHNLIHWLNAQHLTIHSPIALHKLGSELARQASMIAFNDSCWAIAIAFILILPLIFLLQTKKT